MWWNFFSPKSQYIKYNFLFYEQKHYPTFKVIKSLCAFLFLNNLERFFLGFYAWIKTCILSSNTLWLRSDSSLSLSRQGGINLIYSGSFELYVRQPTFVTNYGDLGTINRIARKVTRHLSAFIQYFSFSGTILLFVIFIVIYQWDIFMWYVCQ